jgi:hypothetical protein
MTVARTWRKYHLRPQVEIRRSVQPKARKLSKVIDVVGVRVSANAHAVAFSANDPSRAQNFLSRKTSLRGSVTPSNQVPPQSLNRRSSNLCAALSSLERTAADWPIISPSVGGLVGFLRELADNCDASTEVHLILDTVPSGEEVSFVSWRSKNPRFRFHFVSTGRLWLDQIVGWMREHTPEARERSLGSSSELIYLIELFRKQNLGNPRWFIWSRAPIEPLRREYLNRRNIIDSSNVTRA